MASAYAASAGTPRDAASQASLCGRPYWFWNSRTIADTANSPASAASRHEPLRLAHLHHAIAAVKTGAALVCWVRVQQSRYACAARCRSDRVFRPGRTWFAALRRGGKAGGYSAESAGVSAMAASATVTARSRSPGVPRLGVAVPQADRQVGQCAEPVVLTWRADLDGLLETGQSRDRGLAAPWREASGGNRSRLGCSAVSRGKARRARSGRGPPGGRVPPWRGPQGRRKAGSGHAARGRAC